MKKKRLKPRVYPKASCKLCGKTFKKRGNRHLYCDSCAAKKLKEWRHSDYLVRTLKRSGASWTG